MKAFQSQRRLFVTSVLRRAKEPVQDSNTLNMIYKARIRHQSSEKDTAIRAYKYFISLRESKSPLLSDFYTQLPEDTMFITKHYDRLVRYRDIVCGTGGRFDDLDSIEELFLRLSEINPINKSSDGAVAGSSVLSELAQREERDFDSFIQDMVTLFKRNGGHLFVLDLGIYNVQVFEHFERVGNNI